MNIKINTLMGKTLNYWDEFYEHHDLRGQPTMFAHWVYENILKSSSITTILELGCGDGRDALFFTKLGYKVIAIDGSHTAIGRNKKHVGAWEQKPDFICHDVSCLKSCIELTEIIGDIRLIYSRFFLHAFPAVIESKLISYLSTRVLPGTLMAHEYRTIHDNLANAGKPFGPNERITSHYRRFINPLDQMNLYSYFGWLPSYLNESKGLAVFRNEDPVVARLVYQKS